MSRNLRGCLLTDELSFAPWGRSDLDCGVHELLSRDSQGRARCLKGVI